MHTVYTDKNKKADARFKCLRILSFTSKVLLQFRLSGICRHMCKYFKSFDIHEILMEFLF